MVTVGTIARTPAGLNSRGSTHMPRIITSRLIVPRLIVPVLLFLALLPMKTWAQGETTSAIVGQVSDASGAAVPSATVKVTNKETGLKRRGSTDDSGRFNFPQLKPGTYSIKVQAA